MIILHIDTTDNQKTIIKLSGAKNDLLEQESVNHKTQVILSLIDVILKKNKISLDSIDEIRVNTGPGSYTGIRVGIAITNALSFAKNISINGQPLANYPEAHYS